MYVPLDFVASEPGDLDGPGLVLPVTNGLGAGLDAERAVAHGVGEILQRHTNGLRFRALDRRSPVVDPTGLPAGVQGLVAELRRCGIEPVLKWAATDLGVCSTYVVGLDPEPGSTIMLSGCGEAAHPDLEVSLTKALLEYANSRARKAFFFGLVISGRPLLFRFVIRIVILFHCLLLALSSKFLIRLRCLGELS